MFGSDWPVNEVCGGFDKWYGVTEALTSDWSESDKDRFYYSNAERVYRL
jgi:L-fuconolactonase